MTRRRTSRPVSRHATLDRLESRTLFATLVGVTSADELVTFDSATPGTASTPVAITGLGVGETMEGIDYRPATGQLFGLGSTGQLYTLDLATGAATAVGATPVTITGTNPGFDFNPQVDRIRVVSGTDENFRINPNTGAAVDTDAGTVGQQNDTVLAYAAGDTNVGADPNVTAAAYDNNFASTGSTSLYVIDSTLDILAAQGSLGGTPNSPNGGQLTTRGALGVDVNNVGGFDVAEVDNIGYAAFGPAAGGISTLYTVDLSTGVATAVGTGIGSGLTLKGLTAVPRERTIFVLASSGTAFATIDVADLATNPTATTITGLTGGDTIASLDFRPATGELFGSTADGQLYTINPSTGAATAVGTGLTPALTGNIADIDFNPTVDRIRVVTDGDDNARANPVTGALVDSDTSTDGTQIDTDLAYVSTDTGNGTNPDITAAAYTNPFPTTTGTTLYAIDAARDFLVNIGSLETVTPAVSPNTGQLTSVGTAGLGVDVATAGFDIGFGGAAFALVNAVGGTGTQLYSINTTTGVATLIGTVGDGTQTFADVAIGFSVFTISPATQTVAEDLSGGNVVLTVTRGGITEGAATVEFASVTIQPVPATAADAGSDFGTSGQTTFTGTVTFADGETTKTFNVPILDDTTTNEGDEEINIALSDPSVGQLGTPAGAEIVITDDDQVASVTVADDLVRVGRNISVMTVTGTDADEVIVITQSGANLVATVNGTAVGDPVLRRGLYRIVVNAGGGDDEVRINSKLKFPAEIHGEEGDDMLIGSKGRDLLIGGDGTDALYGRGGEDILIGGISDYTGNPTATATLLNIWLLRGNFATRATAISTGTGVNGFVFNNTTIDDDTDRDFLAGEGTADLIFTNTGDSIADEEPKGLVQPLTA